MSAASLQAAAGAQGELTGLMLIRAYHEEKGNPRKKVLLPDSAQIFYRRALLHNNFGKIPFSLATIAEYTGLKDSNRRNLAVTVETNIMRWIKDAF